MQHIACGKNPLHIRLEIFVHQRSLGTLIQRHPGVQGKLVLRDQSNGQNQRVAGVLLLRPRNRLHALIHLRHRHP